MNVKKYVENTKILNICVDNIPEYYYILII